MGGDRGRLRLFVGVYPPEGEARRWLRAVAKMDLAANRPTPIEQVHLTLQFIGDTPAGSLGAVVESVERSASGVGRFSLTPVRLMTLPARGRPRLVAMETDAPGQLIEMKRRLATRLAGNARRRPDDRFTPHLTLCRFTHRARPSDVDEPVEFEPFEVNRAFLMRSVLRPEGAEHAVVREFPLE